MKAGDLGALLATLPQAWATVLPGWTGERLAAVQCRIEAVSADRPLAPEDPLRALRLVAPDQVKVVIIGQDPYPGIGHADGLAFSAGRGRPRSLARIFDVLGTSRPGFVPPDDWALDSWARQGVLLLNPVLTVEIGRSGSHMGCGWQDLTGEIVEYLSRRAGPPVVLLWGAKARAFWLRSAGDDSGADVLVSRHPSYDFQRAFMAEGSHFDATAHLVDWWRLGEEPQVIGSVI